MASNPQRQGVGIGVGGGVVLQNEEEEEEEKKDALFSPRFKFVAEMAGWDEETLLIASMIVEDTPERNLKQSKRINLTFIKSPLTNSRRKRRSQRKSPSTSMPVSFLRLDDDSPAIEETSKGATKLEITKNEGKKIGELDCKKSSTTKNEVKKSGESEGSLFSSSNPVIPCIDKLREELSCAICLEICYEPSTTPCGHSFCKRCLRSAADKCGKRCPKCRQLISNGRSCTVNTVLWNTIQLLFPQEIEARKEACVSSNRKFAQRCQNSAEVNHNSQQNSSFEALLGPVNRSPNRRSSHNMRRRSGAQPSDSFSRGDDVMRRSNNLPSQDTDALLALRLQREEFMGVTSTNRRSDDAPQRSSLALARANLRAMANRATSVHHRGR